MPRFLNRRLMMTDMRCEMPPTNDMIQARQFERRRTKLDARVDPHPDHSDQFRVCLPDTMAELPIVDISKGGLGLQSSVYFPKRLKLVLHIHVGGQFDDETLSETLRIHAIVRRCELIDHKPTYHAGLQFVDAKGIDELRLVRLGVSESKENQAMPEDVT